MNERSFGDVEGVVSLPNRQLDVRASDYELSTLGQDMDVGGCVEQVPVEAARTLLLILGVFVSAWIVWH